MYLNKFDPKNRKIGGLCPRGYCIDTIADWALKFGLKSRSRKPRATKLSFVLRQRVARVAFLGPRAKVMSFSSSSELFPVNASDFNFSLVELGSSLLVSEVFCFDGTVDFEEFHTEVEGGCYAFDNMTASLCLIEDENLATICVFDDSDCSSISYITEPLELYLTFRLADWLQS